MSDEDRRWLDESLTGWQAVQRGLLKVQERPLPPIVVFDARCAYSSRGGEKAPAWNATAHSGEIGLPNGARIPAGPISSNMALDGRNMLVMSLPTIWQPVAPKSAIPLELILEAIMLHELAHAYQASVSPALSFPALQSSLSLPPSVSDDSVQEQFAPNADYVSDYATERDLLLSAAAAPTDGEARELACRALSKMRERRLRYFTGTGAKWSAVDELSLTTEGFGNWIGYTWLTQRRGQPRAQVMAQLGGRSWSQIEGLALFLVIDRLVPGWQRRLLTSQPETGITLLGRACGADADQRPTKVGSRFSRNAATPSR